MATDYETSDCKQPVNFKCLQINSQVTPRLEWTSSHQRTSSGWGYSNRFGDEPKTHLLPLPWDFSAPFCAPKFSPLTKFPSYLPHLISRSFHLHSSGELPSLSSIELQGDARHNAWGTVGGKLNVEGMWRGESKRSASFQTKKRDKKGKLPPFFAFSFSLWFFCSLCFSLFSFAWEKKNAKEKALETKRQKHEAKSETQKWEGRARAWR